MPGKKFWLAVAVQLLVLFGIMGLQAYTLYTGQPVLLKTAPVDPWDPLRGDYVMLRYDISQLQPDTTPMTGLPYKAGDTVWVTLKPGNPTWTAVAVSNKRPEVGVGQVALKGTVEWYQEGDDPSYPPTPIPARLSIHYGIEQFYVPEGQGRDLQNQRPELTVEALVDSLGRAVMHKVFLDGKEILFH